MATRITVTDSRTEASVFAVVPSTAVYTPIAESIGPRAFFIDGINDEILQVKEASTYVYASSNILVSVDSTVEGAPYPRFSSEALTFRAVAAWQIRNDAPSEYQNFTLFDFQIPVSAINFARNSAEMTLPEELYRTIEERFAASGIARPSHGLLLIELKLQDSSRGIVKIPILLKYTYNVVFSTPGVSTRDEDATRIDSHFITPPRTYETLFIPTLSGSFVYNFFDSEEESESVMERRNYRNAPLRDIPKYIQLSWTKPPPYSPPLVATSPGVASPAPSLERSSYVEGSSFRIGGVVVSPPPGGELVDAIYASSTRTSPETSIRGGGSVTSEPFGSMPSAEDLLGEDTPDFSALSEEEIFRETAPGVTGETHFAALAVTGYIGYIIIKEQYNIEEDIFEPVDLIIIPDINTTSFVDWKIVYRSAYRYKIRTLFRFINRDNLPMLMDSDATLTRERSSTYFDDGVLGTQVYYFDGDFSNIIEVPTLEFVKPDPPDPIKIFPDSLERTIFISWNQKNQNKDVVGFNIYRKTKDSFYQRLNLDLLNVRHNYFIDRNVGFDEEYVYAVEAIDVHDNRSLLSNQYSISLKEQRPETGRCENKAKLVELKGLDLGQSRTKKQNGPFEFSKKFDFIVNPLFRNLDENTTYMIRVTSLDTFQEKEIKINFTTKIVNHRPVDLTGLRTHREDDIIRDLEETEIFRGVLGR